MTFGIKGQVMPYAEFAVLDGAWNPRWVGESLADFELMPPKELFNYVVDFGTGFKKNENQKIPSAPQAPSPPTADRVLSNDDKGAAPAAASPATPNKIHVLGANDQFKQDGMPEPHSVVALGLFTVLESMNVPATNNAYSEEAKDTYRDRWV
ncbi:MAG TPA: hypothetical protein VK601_07905 [Kofleriaceae bacterium]|nr:hypothetical protein [Kofleriaceae bacterium]